MWHKPCRTFHPWCLCIKTRCLYVSDVSFTLCAYDLSLNGARALHYSDVIMSAIASQMTGVSIVFSIVPSGADKRKHQSSASLGFVSRFHSHKGSVTRKMFPFVYVIMNRNSADHLASFPDSIFCKERSEILVVKTWKIPNESKVQRESKLTHKQPSKETKCPP